MQKGISAGDNPNKTQLELYSSLESRTNDPSTNLDSFWFIALSGQSFIQNILIPE